MKRLFGFIVIAALLAFMSCSKDRIKSEEEEKKGVEFESLDDFYNNNAVEEQSFVIDTLGPDTIYGKYGTKLWALGRTKFMKKSNHQDIIYPYTLKLIEAYSLKNMILSRLPNVAQGNILKSGGELKITAFKDNEELMLKDKRYIPLWMISADTPDNNMQLFYGFTKGSTKDWNNNVLNTDYIFQADSSSLSPFKNGYLLKDVKLGWINCDYFYNYPNKTNVKFKIMVDSVLTDVNLTTVDLLIVFKNQHAFMKCYSNPVANMPLGEPITVVMIGKSTNGKMYSFNADYTITTNITVDVNMTETTEAAIITMLGTL